MTSVLKVTEIQDPTNGNTALTIDSSGRVSRSVVPAWYLTLSAVDSRTVAGEAAIPYAVQTDSGFNPTYIQGGASVSNGVVTVPNTGLYYIHGYGRLDGLASGQWGRMGISINNQTIYTSPNNYQTLRFSPTALHDVNGEAFNGLGVSAVIKLNANETVEIRASVYNDTSWSVSHYDAHFTGYFIG